MSADRDDEHPAPPHAQPPQPTLLSPNARPAVEPAMVEARLPFVLSWLSTIDAVDLDSDAVPPFDVAQSLAGHQPPPKPPVGTPHASERRNQACQDPEPRTPENRDPNYRDCE